LGESAGAAVVVDLHLDDGGAAGERHDGGASLEAAVADRGEEVDLELGGGCPSALLDHRVEHSAEHVIDERGEDPSVEGAEGVEQVGAHVELGRHGGGADVGRADPEVRG
jgi:hypothetical protein